MIPYQLLAGFLALLLFSCLSPPWIGSARPWDRADEFTEGLRCDMTEAEITERARSFPALHLHHPDGRPELLVGQKGDTLIHMTLDGPNLETYQVSWTSGLTRQSCALKVALCSGQELVHLAIVADAGHAGARVLLDGQQVGELSKQGNKDVDVPLGTHRLTIEKADSRSWSTELRYDSSSPGCARLPVPEGAFEGRSAPG